MTQIIIAGVVCEHNDFVLWLRSLVQDNVPLDCPEIPDGISIELLKEPNMEFYTLLERCYKPKLTTEQIDAIILAARTDFQNLS